MNQKDQINDVRVKVYKIGPEMETEKYLLLVNSQPHEFEPRLNLTPNFNLVDVAFRELTGLPPTEMVEVHGTDVSVRGAILKERLALGEMALEDEELFRFFLFAQGGIEDLYLFADGTWGDADPQREAVWVLKANDEHLRKARASVYETLVNEFRTKYNQNAGLE